MRVIVTGSRHWTDLSRIFRELSELYATADRLTVAHGGCPTGADAITHRWITALPPVEDLSEEVFPADWAAHGRRAGPIRNEAMIKAGADLVLAFPLPGGRGTQHTIRLAREAGIPVKVWGSE